MARTVCACGRPVETEPAWAGQWITCPGCGGPLYAPFPGDKPAPDGSAPAAAAPFSPGPTRLCPACSETIPVADPRCRYCGASRSGDRPIAVEARPMGSPPPAPEGGLPALIVGIVGYASCGLLSPVAWAMASSYLADCRRRGVEPSGAGRAARVVGIVGTVFLAIYMVGCLLWLVCACL